MTNWHDPALKAAENLAFVKLFHVIAGVYIWELVSNLDYEYSIIMGRRKFKWSVPVRAIMTLTVWEVVLYLAMTLNLVTLTTSYDINCEAVRIASYIFSYLANQSASVLVTLRIYALWERKRIVVLIASVFWLVNTTAYVVEMTIVRAHRNGPFCEVDHVVDSKIAFFTAFITELVLLSLMLFGVLRRKQSHLSGGIWQVMYTQGVIYIVVAILACTPTLTFLLLNLNEVMDLMFLFPSMTVMSICASRMYRGLVDSAALNGPLGGVVGVTRPSTIRLVPLNHHEETTRNTYTGGAVPDICPTASLE